MKFNFDFELVQLSFWNITLKLSGTTFSLWFGRWAIGRNEILIDKCNRSEHSGLGCLSLSCVIHFWCVKNQSISHVLILWVLSRACQCTIHLPSIWCTRWILSAFSTIFYTSTCNWNTLMQLFSSQINEVWEHYMEVTHLVQSHWKPLDHYLKPFSCLFLWAILNCFSKTAKYLCGLVERSPGM